MENKKVVSIEFDDGNEVLSGLKQAFAESKVQRVALRSVEGKIKDFELNIFKGGNFRKKRFDEEFKVTSIHGTFFEKGNMGYKGDLVVSLAGKSGDSLGGTLLTAKAAGKLIIKADIIEFK